MKVALLLLFPCLAFGRVGEKLDEFKKRTGAKPFLENTTLEGITAAVFTIDAIEVETYASNGVIRLEVYRGVNLPGAKAILAKQVAKFNFADSNAFEWADPFKNIFAKYDRDPETGKGRLTVRAGDGDEVRKRAEFEPRKKQAPTPAEKF